MCCAFINAQFTTPNNGTSYTLTSLSAAAPTVLVKNGLEYTLTADLTLSATDKLLINEDATLKVNSGIAIYIYGEYKTTAGNFTITASTIGSPYRGIRFEEGSVAEMKNTRVEYGGGVRVLTANPFLMDNCILYKNNNTLTTSFASSAALALYQGSGHVVKNSQFLENSRAGINSGASGALAVDITNNYFYGNNTDNGNYPQINMGSTGSADSTRVVNNIVTGNRAILRAGGISVSGLLGGITKFRVEGNTIRDNRYGITHQGAGTTGIDRNNIIENNNTENNPNLGGSGISLTGTQNVIVRNNQIRGNLWGITILSNAVIDLGTSADDKGNNIFKNNGNGGTTTAFFNNTPNQVNAIGNCWREDELSDDAMVQAVIGSQTANTVNFKPYNCALPLSVSDVSKSSMKIYPNPSKNHFFLETENAGNIVIQDLSGKVVFSSIVTKGKNEVNTNLQSGVYIITQQSEGKKSNTKLIIK